jgi:hypothetical protein
MLLRMVSAILSIARSVGGDSWQGWAAAAAQPRLLIFEAAAIAAIAL